MRKISRAVLVAAALTFAGGFAVAQDDPHQSAQNSDTSLPNSPWKARGIPDSGEFNPTGPRYEAPPPPVAPPPPPPPPVWNGDLTPGFGVSICFPIPVPFAPSVCAGV